MEVALAIAIYLLATVPLTFWARPHMAKFIAEDWVLQWVVTFLFVTITFDMLTSVGLWVYR